MMQVRGFLRFFIKNTASVTLPLWCVVEDFAELEILDLKKSYHHSEPSRGRVATERFSAQLPRVHWSRPEFGEFEQGSVMGGDCNGGDTLPPHCTHPLYFLIILPDYSSPLVIPAHRNHVLDLASVFLSILMKPAPSLPALFL